VTVIKTPDDDPVVAFLCTTRKDDAIELETEKGRKLTLSPRKYEVASRGGKGHEMAKKDRIKVAQRPVAFVPLPEETPEGKG
jgi:DNA gyrase subunit A